MKAHRILVPASFALCLVFLANVATAQPTPHVLPGELIFSQEVIAVDMDQDEDIDILASSVDDLVWWENLGEGEFSYHLIANGDPGFDVLWAGDLDSDGDIDMITGSLYDLGLTFRLNNGDQTFSPSYPISPFNYPIQVNAADVDNDGDMDLFSSGGGNGNTGVYWWENLGDLEFSDPMVIYTTFSGDQGIGRFDLGDLDNDGDLDMVWPDRDVYTYVFEFNGGFQPGITYFGNYYPVYGVDIDDINDDGKNDFVAVQGHYQSFQRNIGNFEYEVVDIGDISSFYSGLNVESMDFDRDGDTDFIYLYDGPIIVFENTGNDQFVDTEFCSQSGITGYMDIADLDEDGDVDIVVSTDNPHTVTWWENDRVTNVGVSITLSPFNSPTVIPEIGGWLGYSVDITNTLNQGGTCRGRVAVYGPGDSPNLFFERAVNIQPGIPIGIDQIAHYVPAWAPPGEYLLVARLGFVPNTIIAEDAFYFIKEPFPLDQTATMMVPPDSLQLRTRILRK